jgi:hypothetical protein
MQGGQNDNFRPLTYTQGGGGALILDRWLASDLFASVDAHLCKYNAHPAEAHPAAEALGGRAVRL